MLLSPSCPVPGQNSRGLARMDGETRPVLVDFVDPATGFLFCHDIETSQNYRVHKLNFTMSTTIPSRLRQYAFDSCAPYWQAALRAYPGAVKLTTGNLSAETVARKLRESRIAKTRYGWLNPLVNEEQWFLHANEIEIRVLMDGCILMGTKDSMKEKSGELPIIKAVSETPSHELSWASLADLEHFCSIKPLLKPLPSFFVLNLTPEQIESLENRYDVGFVPDEHDPKKHLII